MKHISSLILLLLFCNPFLLYAQESSEVKDDYKYNAAYLEIGGPTLIYSLGYERTLVHSPKVSFLFSLAIEYIPTSGGITMFSLEPDVLFHFKKHAIEAGLAFSFGGEGKSSGQDQGNDNESSITLLVPRIGYRYFFSNNSYIRCGITPLVSLHSNDNFPGMIFWVNLMTFGYKF